MVFVISGHVVLFVFSCRFVCCGVVHGGAVLCVVCSLPCVRLRCRRVLRLSFVSSCVWFSVYYFVLFSCFVCVVFVSYFVWSSVVSFVSSPTPLFALSSASRVTLRCVCRLPSCLPSRLLSPLPPRLVCCSSSCLLHRRPSCVFATSSVSSCVLSLVS